MSWYAKSSRAARQVASDVFVVGWGVLWWLVSRAVRAVIAKVAEPAQQTAAAAQQMADAFTEAAAKAGGVPGVGGTLRQPFDDAAASMAQVVASAQAQVVGIERVAEVVGWLTFGIPLSIIVAVWLPVRIRFALNARATHQFIDAQADLDLFALRAMATQPMSVLARISDDPVAAWRNDDRAVINKLAEAELRRTGVRVPAALRH